MRTLKVSLRRNNSTVAVFDYEDDKKLVSEAEVVGLLAKELLRHVRDESPTALLFDVDDAEEAINTYASGEMPCAIVLSDY